MQQFHKDNLEAICRELARRDPVLRAILTELGLPPLWKRPNTFATLVLSILEQQVSLASAYAAYERLRSKLGRITPDSLLALSDAELRDCWFSRQKIVYVRELAQAILSKQISLRSFRTRDDETVRSELIALKGIGPWTIDVYLLHVLQRTDIFPIGDVALVNAVRMVTNQPLSKPEILQRAEKWRPYRSVATLMLWHYYITKKNLRVLH